MNGMNVVHLNVAVFDLNEVVLKKLEPSYVRLTFRNGDEISLHWRDPQERVAILQSVGITPVNT